MTPTSASPPSKRQRRLMSVTVKSWSLISSAESIALVSRDHCSSARAVDAAALSLQASSGRQSTTHQHPTRPKRTATHAHAKKLCSPHWGIWILAGCLINCRAVVASSSSSPPEAQVNRLNFKRRIRCTDELCGQTGYSALQRPTFTSRSFSVAVSSDWQVLLRRSRGLARLKKRQNLAISTPSTSSSSASATSTPKQITIPDGWKSIPRETNYYAVPVIVAISVLVAILVIATVVGSAIWRRKKHRRKRKHPAELEKGRVGKLMEQVGLGSLASRRTRGGRNKQGGTSVKSPRKRLSVAAVAGESTSFQDTAHPNGSEPARSISDGGSGNVNFHRAGPSGRPVGGYRNSTASTIARIRRRREQRAARAAADDDRSDADEDEDEDDESRALTGSHSSRNTPENTLTARIAARLLSAVSQPPSPSPGPSTIFRELDRAPSASTTQSVEDLSRVSSRASTHSHSVFDRGESGLREPFTPAVLYGPNPIRPNRVQVLPDTSTTATFGASPATAGLALPIPGPPAYRPSSTTIAMTTRFSPSRAFSSRPAVEDHDPADMWHWPNEKGLSSASVATPFSSGASSSTRAPQESLDIGRSHPATQHDSSIFTAHLATDDKTILARLREQVVNDDAREGPQATSSRTHPLASATAPVLPEDDGEDAWLGFASESDPPVPAPSAPLAALLPAPSQPVATTFDYSAPPSKPRRPGVASVDEYEQAEMGYLPVYERRRNAEANHAHIMARATAPISVPDGPEESANGAISAPGRPEEGANGAEPRVLGLTRLEHREV
ncbi:hypothetical protein, variant [Microbotryum lychnidis-dioicae p1A1 Lamole]|nr:hypothetical protein, variant [Microbotryum lychnidis-dioicae p1A1 Lamole]|eukprot:KDE03014.1 hypothetical protein, variant [Microbotryum lychnidis-dioicae p1A1 Lamole]